MRLKLPPMHPDWHDVQRKFYDATAAEHSDNFEQGNPYFEFVNERFLRAIDPRPGEKILELGSSGGRFTLPLLDAGCQVTGVDISPRTIEYLERTIATHPRRAALRLVEDDASLLSKVEARDFDAVVGGHILHHVPEVAEVATRAWARLRPGGRSVFLEPNPINPLWYIHIATRRDRSWRVERGILRVGPGRVRRAFLRAGFAQCSVTSFGCFPPFVLNWIPAARALEAALERLPSRLARLLTLNLFVARKAL